MSLNATSLAAATGVSVTNTQFKSGATNLARKILVVGTHLPANAAVVPNVPVLVLSAEDAGSRFGFGSMLHRLIHQAFIGSQGVELWAVPQAEVAGAASTGSVNFTGSAGVAAGTLSLYIAGIAVPVSITAGMTAAQIATAVVAAITADKTLPVTAAVDGVITGKVNITAKSKGPWGDAISIKLNLGYGTSTPVGVTAVIIAMATGSGTPTMANALAAIGTGDNANEAWFTDMIHGYGTDSTTLDAISAYVGAGNDYTGCYSKTVARPFRTLCGDVSVGSAGLNALIALADARLTDRANGILAVPGSASHPAEIAAQAMGHMARINNDRVSQHYVGIQLIGIDPGAVVDRWTKDYDSRDTAVKSGISPTRVENSVVTLQNVITFYRPDSIPVSSNGYRSMRNISIIQNMLYNVYVNFKQEKWQGISIVSDTNKVTSAVDRKKARDTGSVIDDLIALAKSFETKAWIYDAGFTITMLKRPGAVSIRTGGLGFDNILSVIFSGEGSILDTDIQFDTSLAILIP